MSIPVDIAYTKWLPKVELHAHLTGSITPQCLHDIWTQRKLSAPDFALQDPLKAMSKDPSSSWDIVSFFPLFSTYIYALCDDISSVIHSTNSVLQSFKDDGVVHLELRTTPRCSLNFSKEGYVESVLECVERHAACRGMVTYLILSVDRRNTLEEAMEAVDLAIRFRSRGVVGVDLCGDPRKGDVSIFRPAFEKAKRHDLKTTLHFAEVSASSSATELETLLSFEPDRLGHVIHVPENLKLEIMRRNIGVELCISCNVLAKMTQGGLAGHHFRYWWDNHHPTDDVGVFGSPLSNEYLIVADTFGLSRLDLLDLCRRSIESTFGGEVEKVRLRKVLDIARKSPDLR